MNIDIDEQAEALIQAFLESLSDDSKASLSQADLERLKSMVKSSYSKLLDDVVNNIENLSKKIRSAIEHPNLDL